MPSRISAVRRWHCLSLLMGSRRRGLCRWSVQLPAIFGAKEFVQAGGLVSYGPYNPDLTRLAAKYVAKIREGANPGDLPIEQPTKFILAINLHTAKALRLTVPQSILARANEVIE